MSSVWRLKPKPLYGKRESVFIGIDWLNSNFCLFRCDWELVIGLVSIQHELKPLYYATFVHVIHHSRVKRCSHTVRNITQPNKKQNQTFYDHATRSSCYLLPLPHILICRKNGFYSLSTLRTWALMSFYMIVLMWSKDTIDLKADQIKSIQLQFDAIATQQPEDDRIITDIYG